MARIPEAERSTYKKRAIPCAVRREVAYRYGSTWLTDIVQAPCFYCGWLGGVHWGGRSWVNFEHELDHVIPERLGGPSTADNIVLACRRCNRRKGHRVA